MKKSTFLLLLFLSFNYFGLAQNSPIIPVPNKLEWKSGSFLFTSCTKLEYDRSNQELQAAVSPLVSKLKQAASVDLDNPSSCKRNAVLIKLNNSISNAEGYSLKVTPSNITVEAQKPAGVFYAIQSLLQLLPASIESKQPVSGMKWSVRSVQIEDAPRFVYRGIMLDAARHFYSTDSVKRFIDLLAAQKMNRLHWHLTDGEGWRFESKKFPKVNKIGAYRKGDIFKNEFTYDYASKPNEKVYGGSYTQDQMKEVVKYAADRFVTIVPEIEMPGHATSAIASYPELACLDSTGKEFPYPSEIQGEFCTKDETFNFLTGILSEVMEVFPSQFIHIGGDEAEKMNWRKCKHCQQRMKDEGLKDVNELQSYFIRRIEKFVNSKGRNIIGWDEIMQGGLAPNAAVMSWTGTKNGTEAAKNSHYVVMSPISHCYLDHHQSDEPNEPTAYGGLTTLKDVYNYEPIPKELTAEQSKYILGAQGNLWTSYVPSMSHAEYLTFPRAVALAELTWSKPEHKDFGDFVKRLLAYNKRLDRLNVNYSKHLFNVRISNLEEKDGKYYVKLSGSENGYPIYYTTDGSRPNKKSRVYNAPIQVSKTCKITVAIMVNDRVVDELEKDFILHKAVGKKGTLRIAPEFAMAGVDAWHNGTLCDEKRMNDERFLDEERYNDDKWVGWHNKEFDGVLDFEKAESINKVSTRFYHSIPHGILVPKKVVVQVSDDGQNFKEVASQTEFPFPKTMGAIPVSFSFNNVKARYLRVVAEPFGKTPRGNNAFLYVDEVIVE